MPWCQATRLGPGKLTRGGEPPRLGRVCDAIHTGAARRGRARYIRARPCAVRAGAALVHVLVLVLVLEPSARSRALAADCWPPGSPAGPALQLLACCSLQARAQTGTGELRTLLRLRGAGDAAEGVVPATAEEVFRPRVLEDELPEDSTLDTRAQPSLAFESAVPGQQGGEGVQALPWKRRAAPLQPPPGANQRWQDMELSDVVVNYFKARILEESDRPETHNWWRGPPKGSDGWRLSSTLWEASRVGNLSAVQEALALGADVNAANPECVGNTPLHYAANHGWDQTAQLLLERGANVHVRTNWGSTPLHYAAMSGCLRVCELLLSAGADPSDTDMLGHNALDRATVMCHKPVRDFLAAEMSASTGGRPAKSDVVAGLQWDSSEAEQSASPRADAKRHKPGKASAS